MRIQIAQQPDPTGPHWNLKVGGHYEVSEDTGKELIEQGIAKRAVETAMAPAPGADNATKSHGANRPANIARRRQSTPKSDK